MQDFTFTDSIRQEADAAVCCWLATVSADGVPNVSPKELWRIFDDKTLIIANIASPVSMRNVRATGRACVSFIDIFRQKGYKLTGHATYISAADDQFGALSAPLKTIAGDAFKINGIFKISPNHAASIVAPSYAIHGATEEDMIAQSRKTYGIA